MKNPIQKQIDDAKKEVKTWPKWMQEQAKYKTVSFPKSKS